MKTLLFVRTENNSAFDGSVKGTALKLNGPVTPTKVENQFQLSQGFLETGAMPELEKSGVFTVEALVTPDAVLGSRQNIMESQKPPIAFFIDGKDRGPQVDGELGLPQHLIENLYTHLGLETKRRHVA